MLLKNCRLLDGDGERTADILIIGSKIVKIAEHISSDAEEDEAYCPAVSAGKKHSYDVIDVNKRYVLPGMIDAHVHLRDPGLTHKEDLHSGSCAAAKGGVTSFFDMPNTIPPTFTNELLNIKRRLAKEKSIVNYAFHFGASAADNSLEIKKAKGVPSTKVYMNATTGNLLIEDEKVLYNIFSASRIVSVHSEEKTLSKAIRAAKDAGAALYACHISLSSEIDEIRKAKAAGQKVYCEAAPHHLFLTKEDNKDAFTKMIPCLKSREDQAALWKAIDEGVVDAVGTDHAPHTIEEKKDKNPPAGVPGLEFALPLLLDAVNKSRLTLKKLVELFSQNPARIWNIKNKGKIEEGYDADIVIVDMGLVKEVKNCDVVSKCGWSPYCGMTLKGWPVMTIASGNIVYDYDKIFDEHRGVEVEFI